MKDYLDGVTKITTIMGKRTFECRKCGLRWNLYSKANRCCTGKKAKAEIAKGAHN